MRQAYEIVQYMDAPDLGLTIDAFNVYLADKCADLQYLRNIDLDKIFIYHIDDCEDLPLGILDHCHRLMPGDGIIPLRTFTDILKEKGYADGASIELFRPEYWEQEPESIIELGARKANPFL